MSTDNMVAWVMAKIDQLFAFFAQYSSKYANWIVLALVLWITSKFFNFKLKLGK